MDFTPITTQQPLPIGQKDGHVQPTELLRRGPVSVRNATESEEDREFIGKLVIEAFERKVVHATSRARYDLSLFLFRAKMNFFFEINFFFYIFEVFCRIRFVPTTICPEVGTSLSLVPPLLHYNKSVDLNVHVSTNLSEVWRMAYVSSQ